MPSQSRRGRIKSAASWAALALLGLVLAAAVSLAASRLSSQHIGLSAEPLSAGQGLAPVDDSAHRQSGSGGRNSSGGHRSKHVDDSHTGTQTTAPTTSAPVQPLVVPQPPTTTQTPRRDDSGGDDSGGSGRGRAGGDD